MKIVALGLLFGLLFLPSVATAQCTYAVGPDLAFGNIVGVATSHIDVTTTIEVQCPPTDAGTVRRVCLSIPAGTGDASITDRRIVNGSRFVPYQLSRDAARTAVWGDVGAGTPAPHPIDFGPAGGTQTVTVDGRVFAAETRQAVGSYQSLLTPIVPRSATRSSQLPPPDCQILQADQESVPPILAQLTVETNCTVNANPLEFGTVAEITGNAATTNLAVTCTVDGPYTIALDGGATGDIDNRHMQLGPGPETIEHQLYQDAEFTRVWGDRPGTTVDGTGTGSPQSVSVFGLVLPQDPIHRPGRTRTSSRSRLASDSTVCRLAWPSRCRIACDDGQPMWNAVCIASAVSFCSSLAHSGRGRSVHEEACASTSDTAITGGAHG